VKFENKRKNHLKSKLIIDQLFSTGRVITKAPFRLVFLEVKEPAFSGIQLLISVPKRRFKLAVSRNRIRRLISESFRPNAAELQDLIVNSNQHLAIGIIYIGKKEMAFNVMEQKLSLLIEELTQKVKK
jgi:ribonuclease P protein component